MSGRLLTLSVLALLGFYRYHPVTVQVRDAESGALIRDARVNVHYLRFMQLLVPRDFSGKTDRDGKIKLKVANWGTGVLVEVSADGYIKDRLVVSVARDQLGQVEVSVDEYFKDGQAIPSVSKKSRARPGGTLVVTLNKKPSDHPNP
jgi:hypothetical protein